MAINIKKIVLKKIPYYLLLALLTAGASLILGFLSFGGMYALVPTLSLAFAAFGLSVVYEGEIYLQNIQGAFKKLFKNKYLENYLAKEYLLEHLPKEVEQVNCPRFFKDYEKQLKLLSPFNHKSLDEESKRRKEQIEKKLSDMEQWFTLQLFSTKKSQSEEPSEYALELLNWLEKNKQCEWQARLKKRRSIFNYVKGFSTLAAAFMGLGSTYLIVEAFSVTPWLAAIPFTFWPLIIVPMSIIAGAAYGLLIYNTITDLINNDTINTWYKKLRKDLSEGLTLRNIFMTTMALFLAGLAVALTICTAGTWWTIATNARPLFEWMKKMPTFIMGVINPIITGLSAISFNIQNTAESLEMVDEATRSRENIFRNMYKLAVKYFSHIYETENWLQIFNPFRITLKLTLAPLEILLFLGHLISIAVTADRMPGIPQIVSALIGIISEGFEDAHYFLDSAEQSPEDQDNITTCLDDHLKGKTEQDHHTSIPTLILRIIVSPLHAFAAIWDCLASQLNSTSNKRVLLLKEAWNKQRGIEKEVTVELPKDNEQPSPDWTKEHTTFLIEKHSRKHLNQAKANTQLAEKKNSALHAFKKDVRTSDESTLQNILAAAQNNPVYNQHRLFAFSKNEKTATQTFIEKLPARVLLTL